MRMHKGVRLFLVPGTRIPIWIRVQDKNVEVSNLELGPNKANKVRALSIRGGEASFIPGGQVVVRMPGSTKQIVSFNVDQILEIRDGRGNLIKRNRYCCKQCMRITGEVKTSQAGTNTGCRNVTMACAPCGRNWTLENI